MHQLSAAEGRDLSSIIKRLQSSTQPFATQFARRVVAFDPKLATQFSPDAAERARALLQELAGLMTSVLAADDVADTTVAAKAELCLALQPRWSTVFSRALLDALASAEGGGLSDAERSACASALIILSETVLATRINRFDLAA